MGAYLEALTRYQQISEDLASLLEQRGDLRSVAVRAWRDGWMNAGGEGVTIRRESARLASASQDIEIEKLTGDIEAAQARLRYLDQHIAYLQNQHATED